MKSVLERDSDDVRELEYPLLMDILDTVVSRGTYTVMFHDVGKGIVVYSENPSVKVGEYLVNRNMSLFTKSNRVIKLRN